MTLKRGFSRLEGVADAKLIVKPAHMEVTMKAGYWPDLSQMFSTIKRAGYTPEPDKTELRVTGTLTKRGDGWALELDAMKAPLALPIAAGAVTSAQLESSAGKSVLITGSWQAPSTGDNGPGTLRATEIGPAK